MRELERDVEREFCRVIQLLGGEQRKLEWVGRRGAPDRIVLLEGGVVAFAELKRPKGGRVSPLQQRELDMLNRLGFVAEVVQDFAAIQRFAERLR